MERMAVYGRTIVWEVNGMQYSREDGCKAWLAYACLRPSRIRELLEEFGSAEAIYDRFISNGGGFLKKRRISDKALQVLEEHADRQSMHQMMLSMQKYDVGIVTPAMTEYPDSLRSIPEAPEILFYRGSLDCLIGKCVTVIGSRRASLHGIEATERLCRELSENGVTVVSGFAVGVDQAAHRGCMSGGSPTAAVLASGIDVDYPADTMSLKEQIVERGGVLLSEYPPGMRSSRNVFQVRNRILSGLGKAVIVMEAGVKSGCMLTVDHALEQGRDVMAYPGIPGSEWSEGAHALLRDGATYFTSTQDVLDDLGWLDNDACMAEKPPAAVLPPLDDAQRKVYSLLSQKDEMSYDQLAAETGMDAPSLSVALTMLQMMGLIRALPGKAYSKI